MIHLLAPEVLASIFGGLLGAGVLMAIFPLWTIQVVALFLVLGLMGGYGRIQYPPAYVLVGLGVLLSASVQLVFHWDKVVVLRFGRFRRVRDAGIFILLPIIDRIADFVDTRIRVTDFSAERTLTRDNVPVHIDALCFWMIWDAGKAILEVENYIEAVTLSAQTALRDAIGKNDLAKLLSEREGRWPGHPADPGCQNQPLGYKHSGRRVYGYPYSQGARRRHEPQGPGGAGEAGPHYPRGLPRRRLRRNSKKPPVPTWTILRLSSSGP